MEDRVTTSRVAGTWEVPIGRGRQYRQQHEPSPGLGHRRVGHQQHPDVATAATLHLRSGDRDGRSDAECPFWRLLQPERVYGPRNRTRRVPIPSTTMACVGPGFWQLDSTLVKYFPITERVKFELRMEFYNLPNHFMPAIRIPASAAERWAIAPGWPGATTAARFSTPAVSTSSIIGKLRVHPGSRDFT